MRAPRPHPRSATRRADGPSRLRATGGLAGRLASFLAGVTLLAAAASAAEPATSAEPSLARVGGTHPTTAAEAKPPAVASSLPSVDAPMSRAAVRARIDSVDPGRWLARYGAVDRHAATSP